MKTVYTLKISMIKCYRKVYYSNGLKLIEKPSQKNSQIILPPINRSKTRKIAPPPPKTEISS
jgi:hypothetical protein